MESTKPCGEEFQYIDIDSIDNKNNIINKKIIKSTNEQTAVARRIRCAAAGIMRLFPPVIESIANQLQKGGRKT